MGILRGFSAPVTGANTTPLGGVGLTFLLESLQKMGSRFLSVLRIPPRQLSADSRAVIFYSPVAVASNLVLSLGLGCMVLGNLLSPLDRRSLLVSTHLLAWSIIKQQLWILKMLMRLLAILFFLTCVGYMRMSPASAKRGHSVCSRPCQEYWLRRRIWRVLFGVFYLHKNTYQRVPLVPVLPSSTNLIEVAILSQANHQAGTINKWVKRLEI